MPNDNVTIVGLHLALTLFGLGMLYRLGAWLWRNVGDEARQAGAGARALAAVSGLLGTIFSAKVVTLVKALVLDVLLQQKVYKQDKLRWAAHICIYVGFMLLLIFHALQSVVSVAVFDDFQSTLNPYLFLRNFFGLVVLAGVGVAIYRRVTIKPIKAISGGADKIALTLLAVIMCSGVVLEGAKIISQRDFMRMNEDYGSLEGEELTALKAYWAKNFSVAFSGEELPSDEETLAAGAELHADSCASCHSEPNAAFMSYAAAQVMKPAAGALDRLDAPSLLYYLHYFACLLGLIYLPFSKFLHIITSPIAMVVSQVMDEKTAAPAAVALRRAIDLDACTHCGTCTLHCSVLASFQTMGNDGILPSEKLAAFRSLVAGDRLTDAQLFALRDANDICTRCHRCTDLCPVGINLQGLWTALSQELEHRGVVSTFVVARQAVSGLGRPGKGQAVKLARPEKSLVFQADKFRKCFECQTCTNSCPVVAAHAEPIKSLDLVPHQIMHALAMGMVDLAMGARMNYDCLTCYRCQEQCPQGVPITDILYELKNMGYQRVKSGLEDVA
ncbi:4Fe-4S dicluster domain-containing protein [Desulfarculus baarsii]